MALSLLCLFVLPGRQTPNAPEGWRTAKRAAGVVEYVPGDLKTGETFAVAFFPPKPLAGASIQDWIKARIVGDAALPGKGTEPKLESSTETVALYSQFSTQEDGTMLGGVYTGVASGQEARLMRLTMSTQEGLYKRYASAVAELSKSLRAEAGTRAAPATTGSSTLGTVGDSPVYGKMIPKTLANFKLGGPLKPGIYEGKRIYEGKNATTTEVRLYLHENGEYRMYFKSQDAKEFTKADVGAEGEYSYKEATGQLDVGRTFSLNNDRFDPADEHTLLLTEPSGVPVIYARDDRGFNFLRTILAYKGPVDLPSPTLAKQIEAEREAAAKRYKWITQPHKGLTNAQIHAILHDHKVIAGGMGGAVEQNAVYILLKDGTVYDGLPVPPDQFDASTARRREPEKWGRWKKMGDKLLVTWPDSKGKWQPLVGTPVRAGAPNTALKGRFGTGSSSVSIGFSSWSLWGVTFKDGRFLKDRRGGAGNYSAPTMPGTMSVNTVYDDDASSTSAVGDGIVVASSKKADARRTRSGAYAIEGYTLVLKYDDGRIVRQPFFVSPDGKGIWFEGAYLTLD